jgi:hypothetical protein
MQWIALFLFSLSITSSDDFTSKESFESFEMQHWIDPSTLPVFDPHKAIVYLQSLHGYLTALGGKTLAEKLNQMKENELKEIQEKLSSLMAPIVQHIESSAFWNEGLGHIGLTGLFSSLDNFFNSLPLVQEERGLSVKLFHFFKYLGCNDSIFSQFL